jgi:hypothetical protein
MIRLEDVVDSVKGPTLAQSVTTYLQSVVLPM